jgi:hypothetical protein
LSASGAHANHIHSLVLPCTAPSVIATSATKSERSGLEQLLQGLRQLAVTDCVGAVRHIAADTRAITYNRAATP